MEEEMCKCCHNQFFINKDGKDDIFLCMTCGLYKEEIIKKAKEEGMEEEREIRKKLFRKVIKDEFKWLDKDINLILDLVYKDNNIK